MHPNPPQWLSSRLLSTLCLVSGLGWLLLLGGCGGPPAPKLDLETGHIEAPPATPPASPEAPEPNAFREDPMAPPAEAPSVPSEPSPDAASPGTPPAAPRDDAGNDEAAASKVGKSQIQVPQ